jgi:glycerophosphodiester phosphodiesterase
VSAARWFLTDTIASLREAFRRTPRWLGFNIELKYPTPLEVASMRTIWWSRNHFVDAVLKVALEEGAGRRVIFSTFDPDCATLLSLKQPRFPVLFLTCGGTKLFDDPRMNSVEAALQFALASRLQGVVAEVSSVLGRLHETVAEFHRHGLFLYTWGDANNDFASYMAQREAGIDAIILDDTEKMARRTNKQGASTRALFAKNMRSPTSTQDLERLASAGGSMLQTDLERLSSNLNALAALSPIGSPTPPPLVRAPPPPSLKLAMAEATLAASAATIGAGELAAFYGGGIGALASGFGALAVNGGANGASAANGLGAANGASAANVTPAANGAAPSNGTIIPVTASGAGVNGVRH